MKKILILGGTGAIGRYLVDILASNEKYDIYVTSRSQHSSFGNVHYIQGNAKDNKFLFGVLNGGYDTVIDFMNYNYDEMASRCSKILSSTCHYIWFSSCRVYAYSDKPLTEESPRLLETTTDKDFLATNRYALRKARQEDLLNQSGYYNYTIVRPYITYSDVRLQLGIYEKEQWLYRILKGRDLVINRNILYKKTTLSFGYDVSRAVAKLVDNQKALGKTIQIASSETLTWADILRIYLECIKSERGLEPKIYLCDTMQAIDELYEGGYNTIYDRVYNRSFNSSLVDELIDEKVSYTDMNTGLRKCLSQFMSSVNSFSKIDWEFEAYQDILLDQIPCEDEFSYQEDKQKYYRFRNIPIENIKGLERNLELVEFKI